jgi:hypothetical protein
MTLIPTERPIDRCLAEAGLSHDLGDRFRAPELSDLLHHLLSELRLYSEAHSSLLRLGDPIKLALAPDVVLELGDQRQDAHHQLAGPRGGINAWFVDHLELDALGLKLSDNAAEIDCGPGRVGLCSVALVLKLASRATW